MSNEVLDPKLLARAAEHAASFLRTIEQRPVGATATRDDLMAILNVPFPAAGDDPLAVLDALATAGDRGAIGSAGPRYFGFVIGGSLPVTVGADWLTSAWDQNSGLYATSPLMSVIEDVAREWILEILDLPRAAGVGFTTGCQMANFTALAAARHSVLAREGWNVEERGLQGAPTVNVVISAEAHVTILSALRMLGLGSGNAIPVATDEQGRMREEDLRRALARLTGPTIVCAQAGNVNSGSFDPLPSIAAAVHDAGAWLHVDGAFGLWARVSRSRQALAAGIELADSWATDAHKWLNVPYDCGIVIVRDAQAQRAAMSSQAAYLQQTVGEERDNIEWVPDFSRRGRGATVYAALRTLGREGLAALVDRCCAHARRFADILGRAEAVRILNDVVLNQVMVRFGDSDEHTKAVVAHVQEEGTCWLSGTTWKGVGAMRISVSSWATTTEDVDRSAEAILRAARSIH